MVKMSFLERIIKIQMCNSLTSYKKYFHMYRYLHSSGAMKGNKLGHISDNILRG